MAVNVDNWGLIENNQTLSVDFFLNGGQGLGSQWFEATPQNRGTTLVMTNERVTLLDDGRFVYGFDLTCHGRGGAFGLHGGGQT